MEDPLIICILLRKSTNQIGHLSRIFTWENMATKRSRGLSDAEIRRMLDELDSNPSESENEDVLDDSSDDSEVALGEGSSDIDTDFTDGIRYTLGDGESGSVSSDDVDFGAIDWTEQVSEFPVSPLTVPFTGVCGGPTYDAPFLDFFPLFS